ncbi:hypothetical protein KSF_030890 [Reticulibacter mediterranei]|uniref:Mannosyl-glycoprotein endo-beta-N-acetylglucosamidase-like domain-containing protein n=1 Tax=Reticulibacter mediterranei TaxID=2778369 RepID=A0A8J3IET3_9CHLR|nr:glucosaminidase domain-containing protein [Reticulibacter mediterranei]GHO93041.1 hypothetical protein KSF_030890 [Reticulibacter mediterranei]
MGRVLGILFLLLVLFFGLAMMQGGKPGQSMASPAATADSLVGRPSISASFINEVLIACHSPAHGKGQTLYDLGVQYGIDPAWPLAFFLHESSCGTQGMAVITHSLGNLRCFSGSVCVNTVGNSCQPGQSCYAFFRSWEQGFEAWYQLIGNYYIKQRGLTTIARVIPVYAPAADDNDESAYIRAVTSSVAAWRSGRVLV